MKKYLIIFISITIYFSSCKIDEGLNIDEKSPTTVPGSGLFSNATRNMFDLMNSCNVNENVFRLYAQYWAQTTYPDESQYNQVTRNIGGRIWDTMYRDVLQDLKGAKEALIAEDADDLNNKLAIIEFMEVYTYSILVDTFGNIPFSEALDTDNPSPVYDDAAAIYSALFDKLDNAISNMGSGQGFEGTQDYVYYGNVNQWKKAANSLKLRMAMRVVDVNSALSKQKAEEAYSSGVILNNADNFGLDYLSAAPNTNPVWVSLVQSGRSDFVASNTIIDVMNPINDPRRGAYFSMLDGAYVGGIYGSANSPSSASEMSDYMKLPNLKGNVITSSEVSFLLAEAAANGYAVGGTTEYYYTKGISDSIFEWNGTQNDVDTYLALPEVNYATATGDWKQKVATQKWLAMFNNGFEGWTVYRLFDQPSFNAPEGMSIDDIPTRFIYPLSEATLNGANRDAAASAIGGDTKTTKIFWDAN